MSVAVIKEHEGKISVLSQDGKALGTHQPLPLSLHWAAAHRGTETCPKSHSNEVKDRVKPIFHLLAWDLFQEEILEGELQQVDVTCITTYQGAPPP